MADQPPTQAQSRFLSLPTELTLDIISHLSDDPNTLCTLARTCRYVQPLCEQHIYAGIDLLSTDRLQHISYAFTKRPERVEAVQSLKILYKYHKDIASTVAERRAFNGYIGQMKALKNWHIESPFDNFKWEEAGGGNWVNGDMDDFRRSLEGAALLHDFPKPENVGLARLEHLTIHSHGADADFWELKGFQCLFRHPRLRYLHISCVTLPSDLPELEVYRAVTPLTTLIFDECELEPKSLGRILHTPKALKHLTLGENVANTRKLTGPTPRLSFAPEATMRALLLVAHSLETLTHLDPTWATGPDIGTMKLGAPGMREFHCLKVLECDWLSFLHRGIIMNHTLAPPVLQTIRLRHYRRQQADFFDQLPDYTPYISLPSLNALEFVQPIVASRRPVARIIADHICDSERVRDRHAYAYKLWKAAGIRMTMYAEIFLKSTYIPPFLHGEPLPELLRVYDSVSLGFRRVVFRDDEDSFEDDDQRNQAEKNAYTQSGMTVEHLSRHSPNRSAGLSALFQTKTKAGHIGVAQISETDQLLDTAITQMRNQVWRALDRYQSKFMGPRRYNHAQAGGGMLEMMDFVQAGMLVYDSDSSSSGVEDDIIDEEDDDEIDGDDIDYSDEDDDDEIDRDEDDESNEENGEGIDGNEEEIDDDEDMDDEELDQEGEVSDLDDEASDHQNDGELDQDDDVLDQDDQIEQDEKDWEDAIESMVDEYDAA